MADGALNLKIEGSTAANLAREAKALGVSPDELVTTLLDQRFFNYDDFTWLNGDPRTTPVDHADFEDGRDLDQVKLEMAAYLAAKSKLRA